MASQTVIGIQQLPAGAIVRITLSSPANSRLFNFVPVTQGLFRVSNGEQVPIDKRDLRRIVSFTRRKFRAQVIVNDTTKQELTLQIDDTRQPRVYYKVILPYNQMFRVSRLVYQALPDLTPEKEERRRRKLRTREASQGYFTHPFDRFVPVSMISLPEVSEVTFLFTVPTTGQTWIVAIPSPGVPDKTYGVMALIADIPGGGSAAILSAPRGSANRLVSQFVLNADSELLEGTTIEITVRDRV